MTYVIVSPDPEIEEFEGIVFTNGTAEVEDIDPELHALLVSNGFPVSVKE